IEVQPQRRFELVERRHQAVRPGANCSDVHFHSPFSCTAIAPIASGAANCVFLIGISVSAWTNATVPPPNTCVSTFATTSPSLSHSGATFATCAPSKYSFGAEPLATAVLPVVFAADSLGNHASTALPIAASPAISAVPVGALV